MEILKVLLLGDGLVGSALNRILKSESCLRLSAFNHSRIDVLDSPKLTELLILESPDVLINAVGSVGGIAKNIAAPATLLTHNSMTNLSILKSANQANIARYIQFASACVYPAGLSRSMKPSDIGTAPMEQTSIGYSTAKLLAIEAVNAYRSQFSRKWITLIPTNIYGRDDWRHGDAGHVIGMLTEKIILAIKNGDETVSVWGDGSSLRDFLFVEDLALATKHVVLNNMFDDPILNVAGSGELSIGRLSQLLGNMLGFQGKFVFDATKPTGARRKILDGEVLKSSGWNPSRTLEEGLIEYLSYAKKFFNA